MVFKHVLIDELTEALGFVKAEFYEKLLYFEKAFLNDYFKEDRDGDIYKGNDNYIYTSEDSFHGFNHFLTLIEIGSCLEFLRNFGFIDWDIEQVIDEEQKIYIRTIKYKFIISLKDQAEILNNKYGTNVKTADLERITKGIRIMGQDEYERRD